MNKNKGLRMIIGFSVLDIFIFLFYISLLNIEYWQFVIGYLFLLLSYSSKQ